jgi:hypothetical protein
LISGHIAIQTCKELLYIGTWQERHLFVKSSFAHEIVSIREDPIGIQLVERENEAGGCSGRDMRRECMAVMCFASVVPGIAMQIVVIAVKEGRIR